VEAQPTLVRTQRAVELHPVAPVYVDLAMIIVPGDPEDDLALRFADTLNDLLFGKLGMFRDYQSERFEYLVSCLVELERTGTVADYIVVDRQEFLVDLSLLYKEWLGIDAAKVQVRSGGPVPLTVGDSDGTHWLIMAKRRANSLPQSKKSATCLRLPIGTRGTWLSR
jgi:hypothetical protein